MSKLQSSAKIADADCGNDLGTQAGPARLQQITSNAGFNNFDIVYKTMRQMMIHVS